VTTSSRFKPPTQRRAHPHGLRRCAHRTPNFSNTTAKVSFTPLLASALLHGLRRCALHTKIFLRRRQHEDQAGASAALHDENYSAVSPSTSVTWEGPTRAPDGVFAYIYRCATRASPETGPFAPQFSLGKRDISLTTKHVQTHHRPGGAFTFIIKIEGGKYLFIATGHQRIREPLGTGRREETNKPAPRSSAPASPHDWDSATTKENGRNIKHV
jgi:hypothetical protein